MSRTDGIFSRLLLMISRDILMVAKPTCIELERKIKDLEKERKIINFFENNNFKIKNK